MQNPGAVIAISSHVVRGSVGNRAVVFTLERLGFTVWSAPTIVLPHHPGHGPAERVVPESRQFASVLETLVANGRAGDVAAVLSGYFADPAQVSAVAALVREVKAVRPDALYFCDPVIGDLGRLYVAEAIAAGIRDVLIPLADITTPNAFECAWLAGQDQAAASELWNIAEGLPPPVVMVTSAPALTAGNVANLLTAGGHRIRLEHPAVEYVASGSGDVLAAVFLARRLQGRGWRESAELAVASVFGMVAGTARAGADELLLADLQDVLVEPKAAITVQDIS